MTETHAFWCRMRDNNPLQIQVHRDWAESAAKQPGTHATADELYANSVFMAALAVLTNPNGRGLVARRLCRSHVGSDKSGNQRIRPEIGSAPPHWSGEEGHYRDENGKKWYNRKQGIQAGRTLHYVKSTRAVYVGAEWLLARLHELFPNG